MKTVIYEPLTASEIEATYTEYTRLNEQAERLRRLLAQATQRAAVDKAVELVLKYRREGGTLLLMDWALDLLERAYADETDPVTDPAAWEPPL